MTAAVRKYTSIFAVSLQNQLAYVGEVASNAVFFVFILFVMAQLWQAVYSGQALIAGFSLVQVVWYLIVTETIVMSRSSVYRRLSDDVQGGDVAYLLNRPYNLVLYHAAEAFGQTMLRLVLHAGIGLAVGLVLVGPLTFRPVHLPLVLLMVVAGAAVHMLFYFGLALTAFWIEDNTAFFFIYQKIVFFLGGMMIPLDFFPEWLQAVSKALPFAYVTYYPARLAVNFEWDLFWRAFGVQALYLALLLLVVQLTYRAGARVVNINGG